MPTGYTSDIYNGKKVSFKTFAMECARAFGALIELRDDTSTKIPEEFKPDSYHLKELAKAEKLLLELSNMTQKNFEAEAESQYEKEVKEYREEIEKHQALSKRYNDMISKVKSWIPPTSEHNGLKKFMLEQLKESKEHDTYKPEKPKKYLWNDLKIERIESAQHDIEYHTKNYKEDVEKAKSRTKWITDLRKSLGEIHE